MGDGKRRLWKCLCFLKLHNTDLVRSIVKRIEFPCFGIGASRSNPTLSHGSASENGAILSSAVIVFLIIEIILIF